MLFSKLSNGYPQQLRQDENCSNPIAKIHRGLKKARPDIIRQQFANVVSPTQLQSQQQMSFSSLSKQKNTSFSQIRLKSTEKKDPLLYKTTCQKIQSRNNHINRNNFRHVQKRLFDDNSSLREESKENKMNFTNVIKKSREKSIKQPSRERPQRKKIIKTAVKQNNIFNKLKNRLIGHKEQPGQDNSPVKINQYTLRPLDLQMVRISMQIGLNQPVQLDMTPSL